MDNIIKYEDIDHSIWYHPETINDLKNVNEYLIHFDDGDYFKIRYNNIYEIYKGDTEGLEFVLKYRHIMIKKNINK